MNRRYIHSRARPAADGVRLHLGCGPKYLLGFINVDANPLVKADLWLDVRCGIPFSDGSVSSIYSTHMLEHFYPDELEQLLRECLRVLNPGGGVRFILPSLRNAILATNRNGTLGSILFHVISIRWEAVFPTSY
jgi:predicted SAM-dependent methyltransferase